MRGFSRAIAKIYHNEAGHNERKNPVHNLIRASFRGIAMEFLLDINDMHCRFDDTTVVDGLSLHMQPGCLACLLGPSGCGKTTVLRAIAGFQPIVSGEIKLNGRLVSSHNVQVPPEKRGLGMVFQDYALFPHLSVANNIGFGLRGKSVKERTRIADKLLELVGMESHGKRYPHELSGGQQQRIALARALAPKPGLLLLDEPFSNLDVELRERLATDVRAILKSQGTAALFVTHDQHEAFVMGERIGVMHQGRIRQWDTAINLYYEPAERFVADFIGQGRLIEGRMVNANSVQTPLGTIEVNRAYPWRDGTAVDVLLRPNDIVISRESNIRCRILDRAFKGADTLYTLALANGDDVLSLASSHQDYSVGQEIGVAVNAEHLIIFQR